MVGGLVLAAAVAGRRTATAFPRFVAAHGFDVLVYATHPVPAVARLPEVTSAAEVLVPTAGQPVCKCSHLINVSDFGVLDLSPTFLDRTVKLVAGRMPDQSSPNEVLASFTLQQADGVHVGTVINVPFYAPSQAAEAFNGLGTPDGPRIALHVVGIEAAESEFPQGGTPSYDLYPTQAFARAVRAETTDITTYYVRLRHGARDVPRFKADLSSLPVIGSGNEFGLVTAVDASIHPEVIGWWLLAALATLAGLAVIGQALSRQNLVESDDYPTLQTLGLLSSQIFLLDMARTVIVAVLGAAGAVLLAFALSPLTPVGEARLAEPVTGFAFDAVILILGAAAIVVTALILGAWVALRTSRLSWRVGRAREARPSWVVAGLATAGAPPSMVIGVGHALVRGRGRGSVPVGIALFGTALAVTALCATAVFGASLSHLTATPELYGDAYQLELTGVSPDEQQFTGLLRSLRHDKAISRITLGASEEVSIDKMSVQVLTVTPIRGPVLLSTIEGEFPDGAGQIALGSTTMRQVGAHVGSRIRVTVPLPTGGTRTTPFRVVSRVSIPGDLGTGGLGTGAAMSTDGFLSATCPPGPSQSVCRSAVSRGITQGILARGVPGRQGRAAITHYLTAYQYLGATGPVTPISLVNFGEAVNFPLIFGIVLVAFGAATLVHLLVVSVVRRRHETGLLKALGFVSGQIAAGVCWQATTVALVGIVIGVPLGVAVGRAVWRAFATNLGAVPVPIVSIWLIAALALGVVVVANVLAVVPALAAARSRLAKQALRTE